MIHRLSRERIKIVVQPARAEHDERKQQAGDGHEAEYRRSERIKMRDQHGQLNWFPTMDKIANTNDAASSSWYR